MVIFLFGLVALLGWLYVTSADQTAMVLLRKSLVYFVGCGLLLGIPAGLAVLLIDASGASSVEQIFAALASSAIIVLTEELLKLWASRSESSGLRVFALVSLFGIIELMIYKPALLLLDAPNKDSSDILIAANAIPALTLHILTAVIYAFYWRKHPFIQLLVCALIHLAFNLSADFARFAPDGVWLVLIAPLAAATWYLVPNKNSGRRGDWHAPRSAEAVPG